MTYDWSNLASDLTAAAEGQNAPPSAAELRQASDDAIMRIAARLAAPRRQAPREAWQ